MTFVRRLVLLLFVVAPVSNRSTEHCGEHWCTCNTKTKVALCQNHGNNLTYIPTLPRYVTTLEFIKNHLPIVSASTFRNIVSLNLFKIDLANNNISRVDNDAFAVFHHLRTLSLNGNRLAQQLVPEILQNLSAIPLRTLSLDHTNLRGGTDMFQQFRSATLRNFSADYNGIHVYNHSDFHGLPMLNTLSLGHNYIQNVEISYSFKMDTLLLRDNLIFSFPNFCNESHNSYFPNLSKLKLDHNSLVEINVHSLKCLKSLVVFSMNSNKILHLKSNTLSELPKLQNVFLRNMLGGDTVISSYAFNNSNIKYISLTSCGMHFKTQVNPDAFRGCSNIASLDVSYNVFSNCTNEDLATWFGHLTSLTGLGLGSELLHFYPSFISLCLLNLQYLKLYGNLIESLPEVAFQPLKNLTHLWLSGNVFVDIKENFFPAEVRKRLRVVSIMGNPFACDCDLLWFITWMNEEPWKFKDYPQKYVCASPVELKGKMLQDIKLTKAVCLLPQPIYLAIIGTSVLLVFFVLMSSLTYRWRWHIRYYIYTRRQRRDDFNRVERDDIKYDAYVIYSIEDIKWIKEELIAKLQNATEMQLYIRDRDSLAGDTITNNVVNNMAASRAIVVVLSNAMARDEVCQFELMFVQCREGRQDHNLPIVVVLLEEVDALNLTQTVYALVNMHPYVSWGDEPHARELFWQRLEHSLTSAQPPRAAAAVAAI